jgi:hypothetical protein
MSRILARVPFALQTIQASKWIYEDKVVVVLPGAFNFKQVSVESHGPDIFFVFKNVSNFSSVVGLRLHKSELPTESAHVVCQDASKAEVDFKTSD